MTTGTWQVRGREEIMARCPGSGKKCVPQLLRRFKGLRGDARGEAWEGRSGRMLADTMGRSQTAPGMQGSGRADGKLTLVFLAWQWPCWDGRWKTAIAGTGTAAGWDGSITIFGRIEFRTALCSTLLYSTQPGTHSRLASRTRSLQRIRPTLVLLSSGKASRAPAYGGC